MINVMGNYLSFLKLKIILAIHHPRLKESLPGSQNIISKKQTVDQVCVAAATLNIVASWSLSCFAKALEHIRGLCTVLDLAYLLDY